MTEEREEHERERRRRRTTEEEVCQSVEEHQRQVDSRSEGVSKQGQGRGEGGKGRKKGGEMCSERGEEEGLRCRLFVREIGGSAFCRETKQERETAGCPQIWSLRDFERGWGKLQAVQVSARRVA